jgi:hypothetical protein
MEVRKTGQKLSHKVMFFSMNNGKSKYRYKKIWYNR